MQIVLRKESTGNIFSIESVLDYLPTARILNEENGVYLMEAEVFGKGIDMWVRSQGDNITEFQVI